MDAQEGPAGKREERRGYDKGRHGNTARSKQRFNPGWSPSPEQRHELVEKTRLNQVKAETRRARAAAKADSNTDNAPEPSNRPHKREAGKKVSEASKWTPEKQAARVEAMSSQEEWQVVGKSKRRPRNAPVQLDERLTFVNKPAAREHHWIGDPHHHRSPGRQQIRQRLVDVKHSSF